MVVPEIPELPPTVEKERTPEPSVVSACPEDPAVDGMVRVTVPELGAFKVITPAPV